MITRFPIELIYRIIYFLELTDVLNLSCIDKKTNELIRNMDLNYVICSNLHGFNEMIILANKFRFRGFDIRKINLTNVSYFSHCKKLVIKSSCLNDTSLSCLTECRDLKLTLIDNPFVEGLFLSNLSSIRRLKIKIIGQGNRFDLTNLYNLTSKVIVKLSLVNHSSCCSNEWLNTFLDKSYPVINSIKVKNYHVNLKYLKSNTIKLHGVYVNGNPEHFRFFDRIEMLLCGGLYESDLAFLDRTKVINIESLFGYKGKKIPKTMPLFSNAESFRLLGIHSPFGLYKQRRDNAVESLSKCKEISFDDVLDIEDTHISQFISCQKLSIIFSNIITGATFDKLTKLKKISLCSLSKATNDTMLQLSKLPFLEKVSVIKCPRVDDFGLSFLVNIRTIKLSHINVTGICFKTINQCKIIKIKNCTRFSEKNLQYLPNCKVLKLSGNEQKISGESFKYLLQCDTIYIRKTEINETASSFRKSIESMPMIRKIVIGNMPESNRIPELSNNKFKLIHCNDSGTSNCFIWKRKHHFN